MEPSSVTCLTPRGSGGVAVLAVAGEAAISRLRSLFSSPLPQPSGIAYGVLRGADAASAEILDEVLVVCGASSEVAYELHVHGSPFVAAEIIDLLDPDGDPSQSAQPASLSFRERAAQRVHTAPSALGARILLDQAAGAMERALELVRSLTVGERSAALHSIVLRGESRRRLFQESAVALVGPVNAGKSTLFNVLVGTRAASVSSAAGTTRDALLERARLGPWPVHLLDTAGERELGGQLAGGDRGALVELAGQKIALELSGRADVVLRLIPMSSEREGSSPGPMATRHPREVSLGTMAANALGPEAEAWPKRALSAQEAPEHARAVVLEAFESALGLQGLGPLWVPGEAVPFDRLSLGMLQDAAKLVEVDDGALDALLEQL